MPEIQAQACRDEVPRIDVQLEIILGAMVVTLRQGSFSYQAVWALTRSFLVLKTGRKSERGSSVR